MAERTIETYSDGVVIETRTETVPVDQANRADYELAAAQAIDTLEASWDNWATLTAGQKDAALKLTVRVVTRLARLILGRLV